MPLSARSVTAFATGLIIAAGGSLLVATHGSADTSVADASKVLEQAMDARQSVLVPSQTSLTKTATATERASMRARGTNTLSRYFTGQALKSETTRLDDGLAQEAQPDFVVLGGGSKNFKTLTSTRTDEHTITVTAETTTWSQVGQLQATKTVTATPTNVLEVQATLTDAGGTGWLIKSLTWQFAPGSEP